MQNFTCNVIKVLFPRVEKGNSLIEVLVALSLLALVICASSLLCLSSKRLESRAIWNAIVLSHSLSIVEAGYFAPGVGNGLNYWQTGLQHFFPECEVKLLQVDDGLICHHVLNCQKWMLKITPQKASKLPALEFEI